MGNTTPAVTQNWNALPSVTKMRNIQSNQAVQTRAARSRAKAEIVEAPLNWFKSAAAWLDKGITKAAGYNDASFRGQYDYMVAEWITRAECAAYDYCVNTLQELLPQADVERMFKGVGLIIGGAFKETGGIMLAAASATVSWTGLGFFGMGAGIITASAGASDIQQGIEEFSLGWSGDSTTRTTNGLCDMLYGGNENIYHVSTGISSMAGNMLTPYVNAAYSKNPIVTGAAMKEVRRETAASADDIVSEKESIDVESFYDDIFEQQREINFEYESYLDDLSGKSNGISDSAYDVAEYVNSTGQTLPGYKGGRVYNNIPSNISGQILPQVGIYREYDIYPYIKGINRGMERIVIGPDGSVWYTNNHYLTFVEL